VNVHIDVIDESVKCNFVSQNFHSDEVESVTTDEDSDSGYLDVENRFNIKSVTSEATSDVLKQEQLADVTLAAPWRMASRGKGNYFVKKGLLYRT